MALKCRRTFTGTTPPSSQRPFRVLLKQKFTSAVKPHCLFTNNLLSVLSAANVFVSYWFFKHIVLQVLFLSLGVNLRCHNRLGICTALFSIQCGFKHLLLKINIYLSPCKRLISFKSPRNLYTPKCWWWRTTLSVNSLSRLIFLFVFDSLKTIKAKEERRLKTKQQKMLFKANQSAESETPQQAEDSAGQTRKGWFWWQICCSDY